MSKITEAQIAGLKAFVVFLRNPGGLALRLDRYQEFKAGEAQNVLTLNKVPVKGTEPLLYDMERTAAKKFGVSVGFIRHLVMRESINMANIDAKGERTYCAKVSKRGKVRLVSRHWLEDVTDGQSREYWLRGNEGSPGRHVVADTYNKKGERVPFEGFASVQEHADDDFEPEAVPDVPETPVEVEAVDVGDVEV